MAGRKPCQRRSRLGDTLVWQALDLALSPPGRVACLLDTLEKPGISWWEGVLGSAPFELLGLTADQFREGDVDIEALRRSKALAKRRAIRLRHGLWSEGPTAVYFLSVASGLVHHQALLSSRSRLEIDPVFLDLGETLDGTWKAFFERAALTKERARSHE